MSGFTSVRAIFLYYLASSVFLFWHPDFILKDILVAPMYFVMPAGIGLFLISLNGLHARLAATYSRPQLVLSSVFLGLISVTLLYQELERTRLLLPAFPYLYPALLPLSLVGYYRCRKLISVNREAAIRVVRALSWLLPVAAVSYYFVFIHFSSYPLHDVFQRTLFMKMALELSRTGIFNVYISGSYPPIIGVMLAHLHHFYGFDLLRGQWILPAYAWLFHMACYAVFISAFVQDKSVRKLSLVLIAALAPVFYLENMILLESATLVFLAMLIRTSADESSWRPAMVLTFWLSLLFLSYYFLFNYAYSPPATGPNQPPPHHLGLWLLMLVGMYATTAFGQKAVSNAVFLSVIAVSMFLVHRGTLLFFPMVLLVYAIYVLIFRKRIFPSPESKLRLATYLVIGLALFGGAVLVLNALTYFSIISADTFDARLPTAIAESVLRTDILVGKGTGFFHSLVEYLRMAPPLLHLIAGSLLIYYLVRARAGILGQTITGSGRAAPAAEPAFLGEVLFLIIVISPLLAVVLSTVPYVYRGAFFPAALLVLLLAYLFRFYMMRDEQRPKRVLSGALLTGISIYVAAAVFLLYRPDGPLANGAQSYLQSIRPATAPIAATAVGIALLALTRRMRRHAAKLAIPVMLLAVMFDATGFRTLFFFRAYGKDLPSSGVISHYTTLELRLAEELYALPDKTLLMSDPYTLSILRAMTGLNSVYSFANINLVTKPEPYMELFRLIQRFAAAGRNDEIAARQVAHAIGGIRRKGGPEGGVAGEGFYLWNRQQESAQRPGSLMTVEDMYDYLVFVVSAKTFQWANGEDEYYPDNSQFSEEFIEGIKRLFIVEKNLDNRLLALRLRPGTIANPPPPDGYPTPAHIVPAGS